MAAKNVLVILFFALSILVSRTSHASTEKRTLTEEQRAFCQVFLNTPAPASSGVIWGYTFGAGVLQFKFGQAVSTSRRVLEINSGMDLSLDGSELKAPNFSRTFKNERLGARVPYPEDSRAKISISLDSNGHPQMIFEEYWGMLQTRVYEESLFGIGLATFRLKVPIEFTEGTSFADYEAGRSFVAQLTAEGQRLAAEQFQRSILAYSTGQSQESIDVTMIKTIQSANFIDGFVGGLGVSSANKSKLLEESQDMASKIIAGMRAKMLRAPTEMKLQLDGTKNDLKMYFVDDLEFDMVLKINQP